MKSIEDILYELLEVYTIDELDKLITKLINKNQMSNLTLTGILKVKKDESVVNDKFKKLEFVVTDTASQYRSTFVGVNGLHHKAR